MSNTEMNHDLEESCLREQERQQELLQRAEHDSRHTVPPAADPDMARARQLLQESHELAVLQQQQIFHLQQQERNFDRTIQHFEKVSEEQSQVARLSAPPPPASLP